MKSLKFLLLSGLAIVPLAVSAGEISERVAQTQTLLIGTEGTYAPFSFHDKSGQLTGYDVEVIREVAKRLNLTPEFKETQWDAMFAGLNAKRFDVIANQVGATNERRKKYDFSDAYNYSRAVVVTKKSDDRVQAFADLKGLKSAQSLTSNYTDMARDNGAELLTVDGLGQTLELVRQGRVDVTVNDQLAVLDYLQKTGSDSLKVAVKSDKRVGSHFTFLQGEPELVAKINTALAAMKADGTLQQISRKWFADDITQ